ncbi:ABC transporter ATP-binding protein [Streptomyces sp. NPDC093085]|uniref:ABC transporter ATP-binding protein n=1 Tax=Streptomyces sp. NPDC093085 TaxID=3155068 RepID=UPI003435B04F
MTDAPRPLPASGIPATASPAPEPPAAPELLPTASGAATARAALALLRPRRALALVTAGVFVAEAAVGLAGPLALGRIVDAVQRGRGSGPVTVAAAVLLAAALVQAALTVAGRALTARVGESALAELRERVIARAFALPAQRVEAAGAGDLAARVGDDAALVATALRGAVPSIAGAGLTIGFTVLGLATLDWRFALAGLCALPVQAATLRWYLRHSTPLYAAQRVAGGERTRQILQSLSGAEAVRAFRLTADHTRRISERSAAAMEFAIRATVLRSKFFGRLNVAEFTGLSLILLTGYLLVGSGGARLGEATAAALLFTRLFDPVNLLLALAGSAQEAGAGLARLVGVAQLAPGDGDTAPDVSPAPRAPEAPDSPCPDSPYAVSALDVRHAYRPGHPVLHGVDLRIAPGEQVTLVGASGAGKSTLARIVAGAVAPTAGEIRIAAREGTGGEGGGGGRDGTDGGGAAGRPAVLLLDQDTHVFADTVAGNLRLARPDADEAAVRGALDRAGALAWTEALPRGLDTVLGPAGTPLGPVQAQQLALARLVLADPPVAVLDEAAAEAGSEGARGLETAAREVLRGRTALVVAHRLAQAATADRVIVLEAGRIVEEGPHERLLASGGRYAALWSAWSSRTPEPAAPDRA